MKVASSTQVSERCSDNPKSKIQKQPRRPKWVAFVALIVALMMAAFELSAQQPAKIPHIGYLRFIEVPVYDTAFRKGLADLGYIEGRNIRIEYRFAGANTERLAQFAAELVNLKMDVIVAGSTQSIDAAKRATQTIPIVFPVTFDPVGSGYVASLARPGGNLTGLSTVNPDAAAKRVDLLKEIMPRITRLAVLRNPTNSGSQFPLKETVAGAKRLAIRLQTLEARSPADLADGFGAASKERADALIVLADALFFAQRDQIAQLGIKHRLPSMFDDAQSVDVGGLISYGANLADLFRRSAVYVDKILKGAKPADLPVEQPTKFEFVINLKTAKQLGLTIPPNVLARADKVIR